MTKDMSRKKRYYNNAPGMFVVLPVEVLLDSRLTDQERRIMMCLCRYANSETGKTLPCYQTITECTGISRSNASNAVSSLVGKGWVDRRTQGRGLPNVYYLTIPKGVEFRTVSSKKRTAGEQAERAKAIQEKIQGDIDTAEINSRRGSDVLNVYRIPGDLTEYTTEEAALAALKVREKKNASGTQAQPCEFGVRDQFLRDELELDELRDVGNHSRADEFQGCTRDQLQDLQRDGVRLPQHIIHKFSLDPTLA